MKIEKISNILETEKEKFLKILKQEKDLFFSNKPLKKIDLGKLIEKFTSQVNIDTINFFNIEAFCRKLNQTLDVYPNVSSQTLEKFWQDYTESVLNRRISLSVTSPINPQTDEDSFLDGSLFDQEKLNLQVELLKMQTWISENKKRVAIVFEGRDGAGKGATIKKFTEYLPPRAYNIVALNKPTPEQSKNWFERYEQNLPTEGRISFFDRSWYNRAVVEPAMGYCTEDQYVDFMKKVNKWEKNLQDNGLILIKLWFSITQEKQLQRFQLRKDSPIKYWKFSENDLKVLSIWDILTYYKNEMFNLTSTPDSPWVVINSNDKKVGILNAMRYVLSQIDYEDKNEELLKWFPEVVTVLKF